MLFPQLSYIIGTIWKITYSSYGLVQFDTWDTHKMADRQTVVVLRKPTTSNLGELFCIIFSDTHRAPFPIYPCRSVDGTNVPTDFQQPTWQSPGSLHFEPLEPRTGMLPSWLPSSQSKPCRRCGPLQAVFSKVSKGVLQVKWNLRAKQRSRLSTWDFVKNLDICLMSHLPKSGEKWWF